MRYNNCYVPSTTVFSNVYIREVIKEEIISASDILKGDSAYEVAVKLGYKGNEEEWLSEQGATIEQINVTTGAAGTNASVVLNGTPKNRRLDLTIPRGDKGIKGDRGEVGPSNYEVALSSGFVGTKSQWLSSIKGEKGDKGDKGNDGEEGKSTYDLSVAYGFKGSEREWLSGIVNDTELISNLNQDLLSIDKAANGNVNTTVVTRTGETYPSAKKAISDGITSLFENGGLPATPFTTKALMTASALVDGDYAIVTNDTVAVNNGLYIKTTGSWVKSTYDPAALANNYTDDSLQAIAMMVPDSALFLLEDSAGVEVASITSDGGLRLPRITGDVQDLLLLSEARVNEDNTGDILNVVDNKGVSLAQMDSRGNIYLTNMSGSLQSNLGKGGESNIEPVTTVSGVPTVGKAVYAKLPENYKATTYQWFKDGERILDANKPLYIIKSGDLGGVITVESDAKPLPEPVRDISKTSIGGIEIGAEGAAGTLYDGYVLSTGDDFNELDIIAPHKPLGKWFTTRTYLAGARGSDSLLSTLYDTDPYHLGYNDSNRGIPVGYTNMSQDSSVLTLNARAANTEEKKHFQGANRNEVASMISSVGAFSMYAGAADDGENILEFRVRHSTRETNPFGWHPTLWTQSSLPSATYNSNEWDISEGTYGWSNTNYNEWGADGAKTGGSAHGIIRIMDGEWHTVTAIFSHDKYQLYIDGVFNQEVVKDTNSMNEPAYALVSNHIVYGNYGGIRYEKEQWDSMWQGATQEVDYIRLWRKAGKSHIKPLVAINPVNISYDATGTITLPSKTALWGRTDVLEHVQTVMTEENEPGGHHTQAYNSLPSFITYDELSRTATINTAGQKSGRLNFVIYGYLQDGSTCEPARTYVNVAPRINVTTINMTANTNYDLYAVCDCGVLVTDGVKRTKVINVSGLPLNASYNDNTGLIYSNDAASGTYPITVQCINSVGQSSTKSINLIIT